ncbi:MAG: M15 family metallopeptidase [Cellulosilyticaceae bacterium]
MEAVKSNRNLNELHPKVKELAEKFIQECKKQGIEVGISETYRTVERQEYLYAQGRTRSGGIVTNARGKDMKSYHQWRLAFDAFQNVKGQEYDTAVIKKMGAIGTQLGLEWGGNWSTFKDTPHFQYTFGLSIADLKSGKKPPVYTLNTPSTNPPPIVVPKPAVDTAYEKAVKILEEVGVVNSPEAWYPTPNTEYTEALIENMLVALMRDISFDYQIKIFQLLGILSSPEAWLNKDFKEDYVKILIQRVAAVLEK